MTNIRPKHEDFCSDILRVTIWGLIANILLVILKFVLGYLGGSKALIADAMHSLSDTFGDIGLLVGLHFWSMPQDRSHPYGHGKYESITALFISVLLCLTAVGIIWNAILPTEANEIAAAPKGFTFWAALISIAIKEFLYRWTIRVGRISRSESVIANAWHHRSDALSSFVATISIGISLLWDKFAYFDRIGAIIVGGILLQAALKVVIPAFSKLTDRSVPPKMCKAIRDAALTIDGVRDLHAMRTRYIGADIFIDMHIEVDPKLTVLKGHEISRQVCLIICSSFTEIVDVMIHIEPCGNDEVETIIDAYDDHKQTTTP